MGKVADGLEVVVETFKVEVPVLPELRVTLGGISDAVTPVAAGGTVAARLTVPENPMLVREIVELTEVPATTVAVDGDALMEKPGRTRNVPSMLVK